VSMARNGSDFLGRGWSFPLTLDMGAVQWAIGDDSIRQAVLIILQTGLGERVLAPTFGSRLSELVFSPVNQATMKLAELYTRQALEQWEPRIDVASVSATADQQQPNRLLITVSYVVRATNRPDNIVYPFYLA
jgi:phage baseplate assembly protein W